MKEEIKKLLNKIKVVIKPSFYLCGELGANLKSNLSTDEIKNKRESYLKSIGKAFVTSINVYSAQRYIQNLKNSSLTTLGEKLVFVFHQQLINDSDLSDDLVNDFTNNMEPSEKTGNIIDEKVLQIKEATGLYYPFLNKQTIIDKVSDELQKDGNMLILDDEECRRQNKELILQYINAFDLVVPCSPANFLGTLVFRIKLFIFSLMELAPDSKTTLINQGILDEGMFLFFAKNGKSNLSVLENAESSFETNYVKIFTAVVNGSFDKNEYDDMCDKLFASHNQLIYYFNSLFISALNIEAPTHAFFAEKDVDINDALSLGYDYANVINLVSGKFEQNNQSPSKDMEQKNLSHDESVADLKKYFAEIRKLDNNGENLKNALTKCDRLLQLNLSDKHKKIVHHYKAVICSDLAKIENKQKNYSGALAYYQEAKKFAEKAGTGIPIDNINSKIAELLGFINMENKDTITNSC